jgi:hypothetical protein
MLISEYTTLGSLGQDKEERWGQDYHLVYKGMVLDDGVGVPNVTISLSPRELNISENGHTIPLNWATDEEGRVGTTVTSSTGNFSVPVKVRRVDRKPIPSPSKHVKVDFMLKYPNGDSESFGSIATEGGEWFQGPFVSEHRFTKGTGDVFWAGPGEKKGPPILLMLAAAAVGIFIAFKI